MRGSESEREEGEGKEGEGTYPIALYLLFRWNRWSGVGHLPQVGDNGKRQETSRMLSSSATERG